MRRVVEGTIWEELFEEDDDLYLVLAVDEDSRFGKICVALLQDGRIVTKEIDERWCVERFGGR